MANIRDLRQRITSVGNIQKITRAMEMVATTKLRRFQGRAVAAQPYSEELRRLVRGLSGAVAQTPEAAGDSAALFRAGNPDAPAGVLFVGSDRGLCGAYNANAGRRLDEYVRAADRDVVLYVIGRKAMDHARRRRYQVVAHLEEIDLERLSFADAAAVSDALCSAFRTGAVSSMALCWTRFRSMMRYEPDVSPFLPITPAEEAPRNVLLEPDAPALLGRLIPSYLETTVFHALLDSLTSEYASRRFAMNNATEAAGDMKQEINREYNRARQAKITSEILEVVAGAEAL